MDLVIWADLVETRLWGSYGEGVVVEGNEDDCAAGRDRDGEGERSG